jgi:molecular chaperone IbpA
MTNLNALNDLNNILRNNTFDRLVPYTFGFDRVFDMLDDAANIANSSNLAFPPVNVIQKDENNFVVELAVAGYKKEEIDVTLEKTHLTISGKKSEKDERNYLVKGIAGRSFTRKFVVLDTIEVKEATLTDGILSVQLENVVPTLPVRKITIK